MRQIRLGILDRDLEYLEPMKAYFRNEAIAKAFRLSSFTRLESLLAYRQQSGKLDLLLVAGEFAPEFPRLVDTAEVCCEFADEPSVGMGGEEARRSFVAKYQPLDQLAADLLELAAARLREDSGTLPVAGQVIAVYSAYGGSGKSMAAWNLAAGMAYYGIRTLYLSLEEFQSAHPFAELNGEDRYGKLLYYAKTDPKGLAARLGCLVQADPRSGLFSIEPLTHSGDLETLTADETTGLIAAIRGAGYSRVVLDLPASLGGRVEAALRNSDAILWLVPSDPLGLVKAEKAFAEWTARFGEPFRDKVLPGVNRYTGTSVSIPSAAGLTPAFYLPYLPEWKAVAVPEQLLNSSIQDLLLEAVERHFAQRGAIVRA
jgi:hypothetical protein